MANSKSAEKRIKVNRTKRAIRVAHKSALKTTIKRYLQSLEGDRDQAQDNLRKAIRALDKAAARGIIHKNAAARTKSRLTKKLAN
ncbi:MAG: 30S ribosomal protein S20 [Firmicutes bacterium]|nr:30S ribosomal protein S20 [Bacillota bacterium]